MSDVKQGYRAVFVSDTHLGFKGSKAGYLGNFLENHHSEHLYLVGDIGDGWRMHRKLNWPKVHSSVIQKLMAKSNSGTKVHYIVGNYDEMFRGWLDFGLSLESMKFSNGTEYYGMDGKRYQVIHGDQSDGLMHSNAGRSLILLGTRRYDTLLLES